jgi:hypothetical protein
MTNPTLKPGTRVRYIGPSQFHPEWLNRTGEVTVIHADAGQADVEWDHPTGGYPVGHAIPFFKLEMVMPTIDWTRPIRVGDGRACRVVATNVTHPNPQIEARGLIAIELLNAHGTSLVFRTATNQPVPGDTNGSALVFKNEPVIETAYVRVSGATARTDCSLHCSPPEGDGVACLEITIEDGVVVGASLHKSNTAKWPITAKQL